MHNCEFQDLFCWTDCDPFLIYLLFSFFLFLCAQSICYVNFLSSLGNPDWISVFLVLSIKDPFLVTDLVCESHVMWKHLIVNLVNSHRCIPGAELPSSPEIHMQNSCLGRDAEILWTDIDIYLENVKLGPFSLTSIY